jgi:hypothetical protein
MQASSSDYPFAATSVLPRLESIRLAVAACWSRPQVISLESEDCFPTKPLGPLSAMTTITNIARAGKLRYRLLITFGKITFPYNNTRLLAAHCTAAEDAANKVERQVEKSAAALLLESRIGEQFDSIVTGASEKGTWARLLSLPVEGKLVQGFDGVDVGDRLRVQLIATNVEQGFIDFKQVNPSRHS